MLAWQSSAITNRTKSWLKKSVKEKQKRARKNKVEVRSLRKQNKVFGMNVCTATLTDN